MTFSNKGDRFSVSEIPDLSGKVAIVTGGNGGIGLEIVSFPFPFPFAEESGKDGQMNGNDTARLH